jgi:hypothetical protein
MRGKPRFKRFESPIDYAKYYLEEATKSTEEDTGTPETE